MRNGKHVRTPRQVSLLLEILLSNAGSVVTRDQIQSLLWPDGEIIDHEHAIHRTINNLRYVLGDTSQKSKFIRTFPKSGYCFIAPVQVISSAGVEAVPEEASTSTKIEEIAPEVEIAAAAAAPEEPPSASPPVSEAPPPSLWKKFRNQPVLLYAGIAATVILLLAAGPVINKMRPRKLPPSTIAIGVAPFEEQSDTPEHLGESFRLDLMDALSQLPNVQVRASHSLDHVKLDLASIRNLEGSLHIDLLLLGKVTQLNKRCTFEFELVRVHDAAHLASFRYDGSKDELATVRDKVQRDIFTNLAGTSKPVQAVRGSTNNPQAYSAYLNARELAYHRTVDSLSGAERQYQAAIAEDPGFARAYAGLATTYLGDYGYSGSIADLRKAERAAEASLRLDPDLAEAHAVLGIGAFREQWDFARGEEELRHAVDLEPHQSAYHGWLAQLLVAEGRNDEALHEIDVAHANDPLWPQIFSIEVSIAAEARRFPRSIEVAHKVVSFAPESSYTHDRLAWALFEAGQYDEALAEWRTTAELDHDPERIAQEKRGLEAYQQGGIMAYAKLRLQATKHGSGPWMTRHPNDFVLAEWDAFTGDNDDAIRELQKMVDSRDAGSLDLSINTMFDRLHQDPRFVALLQRVGLKLPQDEPPGVLNASLR